MTSTMIIANTYNNNKNATQIFTCCICIVLFYPMLLVHPLLRLLLPSTFLWNSHLRLGDNGMDRQIAQQTNKQGCSLAARARETFSREDRDPRNAQKKNGQTKNVWFLLCSLQLRAQPEKILDYTLEKRSHRTRLSTTTPTTTTTTVGCTNRPYVYAQPYATIMHHQANALTHIHTHIICTICACGGLVLHILCMWRMALARSTAYFFIIHILCTIYTYTYIYICTVSRIALFI